MISKALSFLSVVTLSEKGAEMWEPKRPHLREPDTPGAKSASPLPAGASGWAGGVAHLCRKREAAPDTENTGRS